MELVTNLIIDGAHIISINKFGVPGQNLKLDKLENRTIVFIVNIIKIKILSRVFVFSYFFKMNYVRLIFKNDSKQVSIITIGRK